MSSNLRLLPSRRSLIGLAGVTVIGAALAGCGQKQAGLRCSDPDKLTDDEINMRNSFQYVEQASNAAQACGGCAFFDAGPNSGAPSCGECRLLKGPVNPKGHCTSWSARKA
jgi:hypothetical protein